MVKKHIEYTSECDYSDGKPALVALVGGCRSQEEVYDCIRELESLKFTIRSVVCGEIVGFKPSGTPEEICDSRYDYFRCWSLSCEDD